MVELNPMISYFRTEEIQRTIERIRASVTYQRHKPVGPYLKWTGWLGTSTFTPGIMPGEMTLSK